MTDILTFAVRVLAVMVVLVFLTLLISTWLRDRGARYPPLPPPPDDLPDVRPRPLDGKWEEYPPRTMLLFNRSKRDQDIAKRLEVYARLDRAAVDEEKKHKDA